MRAATPPPYVQPDGDPLACLGDRDGWKEAEGGGWVNSTLGVTVKQGRARGFVLVDNKTGDTRAVTSATGALCVIDTLARAAEDSA